MLIAYLDESGIHAGSTICAIAGYVASAGEWAKFRHKWTMALWDAGIETFHMAQFESRHGEFADWSNGRRKQLMGKLIEIIKARDLLGVGSGLVMADYNELSAEGKIWMTHNNPQAPYFLCFQHCIVEAAHRADGLPNDERVSFVFRRYSSFAGSRFARI